MTLDWKQCKRAFHVDGSLRDVYVEDTSIDDYQKLLDHLATFESELHVDGDPTGETLSAIQLFELTKSSHVCLRVQVGRMQVNLHFFSVDEIEMDIDPREVTTATDFARLSDLICEIGSAVGKNVLLTEENAKHWPWFRYEFETRTLRFLR